MEAERVPSELCKSIAFDPADAKAALAQLPHEPRGLCALRRRGPRRALHRPHAQPARTRWSGCCSPRRSIRADCSWPAACGASTGGSPARSSNRCCCSFRSSKRSTAPKALERMHLRRAGLCALPGQQSLSAHHGDQPPQPARGGLGLRAVCLAGRGGALCRRGAQAVPAAPLHRRSGPQSRAIPAASTPR